MNQTIIKLKDGRVLELEELTFPINSIHQTTLIQLWRTEWKRRGGGDYDWLKAMNGDYSQDLITKVVLGRIDGQAVGTAAVAYPVKENEVSVIGSVLTHPEYRRLGIAEYLTNTATDLSFQAGCQISFLGATRDPRNVYLRCGFQWWNGGVMRKTAQGQENCEKQFFASSQSTSIREASWGDLPSFACFVIQPWNLLALDYLRGLLSGKYIKLQRCVSNFPAIYDEVAERGGDMCMLIGETNHRVLGFGSITPGPATEYRHKAVLDVATHDYYSDQAGSLIEWLLLKAVEKEVSCVQVYLAESDDKKFQWFNRLGFQIISKFPSHIKLQGKMVDVLLMERQAKLKND